MARAEVETEPGTDWWETHPPPVDVARLQQAARESYHVDLTERQIHAYANAYPGQDTAGLELRLRQRWDEAAWTKAWGIEPPVPDAPPPPPPPPPPTTAASSAPAGFDQAKWSDPAHASYSHPKYVVGRLLAKHGVSEAGLKAALPEIQALFPGTKLVGKGSLDFGPPLGVVDVIRDVGGANALQWDTGGRGDATPATTAEMAADLTRLRAAAQDSYGASPTDDQLRQYAGQYPGVDVAGLEVRLRQRWDEPAWRRAWGLGAPPVGVGGASPEALPLAPGRSSPEALPLAPGRSTAARPASLAALAAGRVSTGVETGQPVADMWDPGQVGGLIDPWTGVFEGGPAFAGPAWTGGAFTPPAWTEAAPVSDTFHPPEWTGGEFAPQTFKGPEWSGGEFTAPEFKGPEWTGGNFVPPTAETLKLDPGYQFRVAEAEQGQQRQAAARGTLLTGRTLKELSRYHQDAASQEFQAAYNRAQGEFAQKYGLYSDAYQRALAEWQQAYSKRLGEYEQRYGQFRDTYGRAAGEFETNEGNRRAAYLQKYGQFGDTYARSAGEFTLANANKMADYARRKGEFTDRYTRAQGEFDTARNLWKDAYTQAQNEWTTNYNKKQAEFTQARDIFEENQRKAYERLYGLAALGKY